MESNNTQSIKLITKLFFAFFIIAAMLSLVWIFSIYTGIQNALPSSTISVIGSSKQTVGYDSAKLTFYITKQGADISTLNKDVDDITTKAQDYLVSQSISKSDIQTAKSSYPDYNYGPISSEPSNQKTVVENRITITLNEISSKKDKPNLITQELIKLGVTRFDPYQYELKDAEAICETLKTNAIKDAKQKSEERVKAIGGKVIIKTEVNDTAPCNNQFGYPMPYFADAKISAAPSEMGSGVPEVLTGEKELKQEVTIVTTYR